MELFNYYYELPSVFPALNVTSVYFIIFVLIVSFLLVFKNRYIRNIILLIANLFFIWTFSQNFYFIIVTMSFCVFGYISSLIIKRFKNKIIFYLSFFLLVIGLFTFKNINIFNNNLVIPLGISFYVLRIIWYIRKVYSNEITCVLNPLYLFNYLIFFPCFSAGPIEEPSHFIDQIKQDVDFSFNNLKEGWLRFFYGLFEKIVICDYIGSVVERILPVNEVTGITVLVGILLYSFQIYLDFDSYSNIAIGVSKIFGLSINDNFKTPYLSSNIKEFWSRWHISLSSWLKENVYIPLGGNKKGIKRQFINICLVFLVSGIWHGTSLNYIIWGLAHALLRIIEDTIENKLSKRININFFPIKLIRIVLNFVIVSFCWLFFKYVNMSEIPLLMSRMLTFNNVLFSNVNITINEKIWLLILLCFVVLIDIIRKRIDLFNKVSSFIFIFRYAIYFIGIVIFLIFGVYGGNIESTDFIYRWF